MVKLDPRPYHICMHFEENVDPHKHIMTVERAFARKNTTFSEPSPERRSKDTTMSNQCVDDDDYALFYCFLAMQFMCVMLLCISAWQQDRWERRHQIIREEKELAAEQRVLWHNESINRISKAAGMGSAKVPTLRLVDLDCKDMISSTSETRSSKLGPERLCRSKAQWEICFTVPKIRTTNEDLCFDILPPLGNTGDIDIEVISVNKDNMELRMRLYGPQKRTEIREGPFYARIDPEFVYGSCVRKLQAVASDRLDSPEESERVCEVREYKGRRPSLESKAEEVKKPKTTCAGGFEKFVRSVVMRVAWGAWTDAESREETLERGEKAV